MFWVGFGIVACLYTSDQAKFHRTISHPILIFFAKLTYICEENNTTTKFRSKFSWSPNPTRLEPLDSTVNSKFDQKSIVYIKVRR